MLKRKAATSKREHGPAKRSEACQLIKRAPIEKLPGELLGMIVKNVNSKNDLVSLCATSQVLRAVAIEPLYHTITFNFVRPVKYCGVPWHPDYNPKTDLFKNLMHAGSPDMENPGLKHVKHVDIMLMRQKVNKAWELQSQLVREFLLFHLPLNRLQTLKVFQTTDTFQIEQNLMPSEMLTVCRRQQGLKRIQIGDYGKDLDPKASILVASTLLPYLDSVTNVKFIPRHGEEHAQKLAARVLGRNRHTIAKLCINAGYRGKLSRSLDDFTKIMKIHVSPLNDSIMTKLEHIKLKGIFVGNRGKLFAQMVNPSVLKTLQIDSCGDLTKMMTALTDKYKTAPETALKVFRLGFSLNFGQQRESGLMSAVEDFLASFKGLEKILVCAQGYEEEDVFLSPTSICNHAETLECLVADTGIEGDHRHLASVREIAEKCIKLRYVTLPMPEVCVEDDPRNGLIGAFLKALLSLPRLRALGFPEFPEAVLLEDDMDVDLITLVGPGFARFAASILTTFVHNRLANPEAYEGHQQCLTLLLGGNRSSTYMATIDELVPPMAFRSNVMEEADEVYTVFSERSCVHRESADTGEKDFFKALN